jgi:hypothetical protein
MATSATLQNKTHEQIEYEEGFLLESWAPRGNQLLSRVLTPSSEVSNRDDQRKPPLSAKAESRTKSAVSY